MSKYQVAILADDGATTAGSAVIRIDGLRSWPAGAPLRLLPIDENAVPPRSEGWPWGDIYPQRVVSTASGVDVVLGPDVVGCPKLVPGTPITIQVPAAHLEVEARWPTVAPTVRRRAAAVAMSGSQLLAARTERERVERQMALRRQELAEFSARNALRGGEGGQAANGANTGELARLLPLRRGEADQSSPSASPTPTRTEATKAVPTAAARTPSPTTASAAPRARRRGSTALGFMMGFGTAVAVTAAVAFSAPQQWRALVQAQQAGGDQLNFTALQAVLKDIQAAGAKSPMLKSATGVDVATALSLADHNLRGERTAAEAGEAEFWLKRALAGSVGAPDVGWALTQLGTIYASPSAPQHDYVKAYSLWQLAAAQGDPVAHCFLGALFEHGLGVQRDRKAALSHYKIADESGTCRSAKDAVARLSE